MSFGGTRNQRTKTVWVRDEYLRQILDGSKSVKIRVAYSNITRLVPGDILRLNDAHEFIITRFARYADFAELLAHENATEFAPDMARENTRHENMPQENVLTVLREVYPKEKEALGVVALEIVPFGKND